MKRFGIGLTVLGIMLIMGAMGLMMHNREEERTAAQSVQAVMEQMVSGAAEPAEEAVTEEGAQMPTVTVGADGYIGYLTVPALGLELPVMEQWSYKGLKTAPCRYAGSLYTDDLVVMAHNYESHFGRLGELKPGDRVAFTDTAGMTAEFQVEALEILRSGAVEEMTAGEWDLTLFTCTYGGKGRVTVRCEKLPGQHLKNAHDLLKKHSNLTY